MARPTRVALYNDYEIVLEGLRVLLRPYASEIRVVELDIRRRPRRRVDVTLLDTYGEAKGAEQRVADLVADSAAGAVVVFSFSDHQRLVRRALKAGATGFISKAVSGTEIVDGIRTAARGERVIIHRRTQGATLDPQLRWPGRDAGLTVRESELLALLPTGMSNHELGEHFYVSDNTIKAQLRSLYTKLGVHNRTQAATIAGQNLLGPH